MKKEHIEKLQNSLRHYYSTGMTCCKFQSSGERPEVYVTNIGKASETFKVVLGAFYALMWVERDLDEALFQFTSLKHGEIILNEKDARQLFDSINDLCLKLENRKSIRMSTACDLFDQDAKKVELAYNLPELTLKPSPESSAASIMGILDDFAVEPPAAPAVSIPSVEAIIAGTTPSNPSSETIDDMVKAVTGESIGQMVTRMKAELAEQQTTENWGAW